MDSARNVGISAEALELLRKVRRGHDDLGDIDWFRTGTKAAFCWLGGPYRIVDPNKAEGSRSFGIFEYVQIANDVPEGAKGVIDSSGDDSDDDPSDD